MKMKNFVSFWLLVCFFANFFVFFEKKEATPTAKRAVVYLISIRIVIIN